MARHKTGTLVLYGGVWHLRTSEGSGKNRKREWHKLETSDRRVAEQRRKRLIALLEAGQSPARALASIPQTPSVVEWAETWCNKRVAQGVVSARDDAQRLRDYVLPRIGGLLLSDVRASHVEQVLDGVVALGRSKQTVRHVKATMGRLFKAAWRADIIAENPVLKSELPRIRETRKERVILTDPEFEQLMAYLDARVERLDELERQGKPDLRDGSRELLVLCACARVLGGMRTSDVNRWDWAQIDTLHFAKVTVPRTKTDEPQELGVPDDLRGILFAWWHRAGRPSTGPVFPARRGRNAGGFKAARGISYAERLRRACEGAGLTRRELYEDTSRTRRVDFHSFRRAFATAVAGLPGVSMQQAMKYAAHKDPRTHLRYVAAPTAIPEGAIPRLPAAGGPPMDNVFVHSPADPSNSARHTRFERVTFGSGGRRSIQLS